ncbi:MAG: hypothetical protein NTW86_29095 [Candidatus Sumerlaeota bacterium]|nr:hypothetical protein [Candidatus Sumerlaeota bacterium]
MPRHAFPRRAANPRAGFTMAEVTIASAVSVLIATGAITLMTGMAKQEHIGLTQTRVKATATAAIDQIAAILRGANRDTVHLADLKSGSASAYTKVQFEHPAGTFHEVRFNSEGNSVVHDPDTAVAGNDIALMDGPPDANSLRPYVSDLYFAFPVSSQSNALAVTIEITDGGNTWKRWKSNAPVKMDFTYNVNLRSP